MRVLTAARDLFLPRACVACHEPGTWWCAACDDASPPDPNARCLAPGLVAVGAVPYAGPARQLVLAHKNGQVRALRDVLAGWLSVSLDSAGAHPRVVLVPMPGTHRSRRARGFDPVREVATAAAGEHGRSVAPVLRWVRQPQPQKRLDRSERAANVRGRMAADWLPDPVVLVDDVVTTGATLLEAHRALETAGVAVVAAAVMCYTQ